MYITIIFFSNPIRQPNLNPLFFFVFFFCVATAFVILLQIPTATIQKQYFLQTHLRRNSPRHSNAYYYVNIFTFQNSLRHLHFFTFMKFQLKISKHRMIFSLKALQRLNLLCFESSISSKSITFTPR